MRNALLFATLALTACGQVTVPVSDIRLAQLEVTSPGDVFPQRSSLQLRAWGLYTDGHRVELTSKVTWTSSNADTVLVTNEGIAVLRGAGTAVISATWGDTVGIHALTSNAAKVERLALTPQAPESLPKGQSLQLHATAYLDDGSNRDVTAVVQWSSLTANATVTDVPGQYVAALAGTATARASFQGVTVDQSFTVTPALFAGLHVEVKSQLLRPGDLQVLQAVARFSDGSAQNLTSSCDWSTSDRGVLTVTNSGAARGQLVARAAGHATVQAVCGAHLGTLDFDVADPRAQSLAMSAGLNLARGLAGRAHVSAHFDDGSLLDATDLVVFSSSNVNIATVSNSPGSRGVVQSLHEGTAVISAQLGELSSSLEVTVLPPMLQALTPTLSGARVVPNQRVTFAILGQFTDGSVANLTPVVTFNPNPQATVTLGTGDASFIAQSLGISNLQAEVAGQLVQFPIEVTDAVVTDLRLSRVLGIERPGSERLEALATWSDGRVTNVSELADWSSSDPLAALVRSVPGARGSVQTMAGGAVTVRCELGADHATFDLLFPITP